MLEMVFAKADLDIALFYDRMLVVSELKPLGTGLRQQLQNDMSTLVKILEQEALLQNDTWVRESISLRDIYTAPLNLLQAELLRRVRETHDPAVEQALMVTIAGVAAGMRNTG
jgi:phosphoenolpyruvate carboxylase